MQSSEFIAFIIAKPRKTEAKLLHFELKRNFFSPFLCVNFRKTLKSGAKGKPKKKKKKNLEGNVKRKRNGGKSPCRKCFIFIANNSEYF
jgi:hypothetical protein